MSGTGGPELVVRVSANLTALKSALAEGVVQFETTKASLSSMTTAFDGSRTISQAGAVVGALLQIGDVTKLTAAEQAKANAILTEGLDKYRALGREAPPGMQALADATRKVQPPVDDVKTAFGGLSEKISATMLGFVSAEAVISAASAAWRTLTGFVSDSVEAYSKQEDAEMRLVAALRQHGLATPQVIDQYNKLATTFQNTTKYADEDINAMEALLTQVGNIMPSQMQKALKASTDLASGLGIDLHAATMLVAKAAAGHTETLGRYGITVSEAEIASKGFEAVLEAVNQQFGGQAAAAVETYAGKVAQAANAWDNVQEALGKIIIQDPFVAAALARLVSGAKASDDAANGSSVSLAQFLVKLGVVDQVTADAADGLGLFVGQEQETAKAASQAEAALSKNAMTVDKLAAAISNPGITEGLRIQAELVKQHAAELRAAEEEGRKYAAAIVELDSVGQGWKGTLDTIDGSVAEAIRGYLDAGVAQGALAAAYGLTAAQIKALVSEHKEETEALKLEAAATEQVSRLWDEFNQMASKGGSAFDDQVAAIDRWAQDLMAKAQKAGTDTAAFYEALTALWNAKLAAAAHNAEQSIHQVVDAGRSAFSEMNDAVMGLATDFKGWNDEIMNVNRALDGTVEKAAAAQKARDQGNSLDTGHAARDPELMELLKQGWSLENASSITMGRKWGYTPQLFDAKGNPETSPSQGERVPGYAAGVKNAPGGWSKIGERGAEMMYVPPRADIYPAGTSVGGSAPSLTIAAGAVVINYPIMRDARAVAELTDILSKGLLQKLIGQGFRPPSGA